MWYNVKDNECLQVSASFSTKPPLVCCRFVYSKLDGRRDFPMSVLEIIVGASNDSFYDKNRGRTKEARLKKITFICSVVFFVLILFMDIVMPLLTK